MKNKIEIIPFCDDINGLPPATGHEEDAGIDCYAFEDFTVPPIAGDWKSLPPVVAVKLGFGVKMPKRTLLDRITGKHWHAEVTGRSSQNRDGVLVLRGIIDETYEGEITVFLVNLNGKPYEYKRGDRICQLLFDKCRKVHNRKIRILTKEARKDGGFGSTGR